MDSVPALQHMSGIEQNLFYIVGIGSLVSGIWLSMETHGHVYRVEIGYFHGIGLAGGRVRLFLRSRLLHDRSAHAMGLSPHRGRILPRPEPRPV